MAGPFDFTGQNIENTYQRVLQTDGTNFYDGTGSAVTIGGSQTLQQTLTRGSSTSITITSSADTAISGSGTGSFGHLKATVIEGNSPLNIRGVSSLTFEADPGEITFDSTNLFGNPIFHGDINIYSGSAMLDQIDQVIFRSTNENQPVDGFLQLGDNGTPTELRGNGIKLTSALTASIVSASSLTASIHGGTF